MSDFIIENGVLKKYVGPGGDVVIPAGVRGIKGKEGMAEFGAFLFAEKVRSVTIPVDGISIGREAFFGCKELNSVTIQGNGVSIYEGAFSGCKELTSVLIRGDGISIGKNAFLECSKLADVAIMSEQVNIDKYAFLLVNPQISVFAPTLPFSELKNGGLGMAAAKTFIARYREYTDPAIIAEYVTYISSQRKKLLPVLLENDSVEILQMLADAKKITEKNLEQEYLLPAKQSRAEKCAAFLQSLFGETKNEHALNAATRNELWDGVHFSFDGKKLLKYQEEAGKTAYEVPKGTKEICKGAFILTALKTIILPESVTIVRNQSFASQDGKPLFIRFPKSLLKIPAGIFLFATDEEDYSRKYYYVSTPVKDIAEQICLDSEYCGHGRIIYTGGPIDDLPASTRKYAVLGLLYAEQNGLENMTPWRESYCRYLKSNQKTAVKWALEYEPILQWMLDEKLFTQKGIELLHSSAAETNRSELIATMLDYQSTQFGAGREAQTLSENDPEFKRMAAMAERREKIKGQKGIKGLIFVSTGEFVNFGEYNEYTGAKDMGDLKAYIEQRGGFLRSAVSSKTDYLICNNPNSNSVKSKKARELGVPVITEEEFLRMANEKE